MERDETRREIEENKQTNEKLEIERKNTTRLVTLYKLRV